MSVASGEPLGLPVGGTVPPAARGDVKDAASDQGELSALDRSAAEGSSIVANAASLVASRLLVAAMGWAGTLLIVRHLSVGDWGRFSFVFGLLGMMSIFTNMANPRVIFRELAHDDGRLAGTYVLLRLSLGMLAYGAALAFVSIGHYPPVVLRATAVAGLVVVVANSSSGYDVLFEYRMQLSRVAVAAALGQFAQLMLTIALVIMHSSLVVYTVPAVLCEIVAISWKLYRLPRTPRLHYGFLFGRWVQLIKLSIPLAIGGALGTLYYNLDTVMLSKMQTFQAVGVYSISYKFSGVVAVFGSSMFPALFPTLVRYWPERATRFRAVLSRATRLYVVVAVLVSFEFCLFAAEAIGLLYGHHYEVGAGAARLVVVSECLGFFQSLATISLVALNRNVFYPFATLAGLLVNLGLNLWVIPRWSYMGAAWVTLVTQVVVMGSLWFIMRRAAGLDMLPIRVLVKVLISGSVAVGATIGAWQVMPWPAAAVFGALLYVGGVAVARVGGEGTMTASLKSLLVLDEHRSQPA